MHKFCLRIKNHLAFIVFISSLIFIGIFTYKDYGISTDEPQQRKIAWKNIDYVKNDSKELLTFKDKDYGVSFEAPIFAFETLLFDLDEYHKIYPFRHLFIHLFFLIGVVFFYQLVNKLYNNQWLSLLAVILLVAHPRIYAHSFFNSKDIPFLVMLIVSFYFYFKLINKKNVANIIVLGVSVGALINLRVVGVFYLFMFSLFFILQRDIKNYSKVNYVLVLIFVSTIVYFTLTPILWNNPINGFTSILKNMSSFRWEGNSVLLNGRLFSPTNLPWFYIPLWVGITTPIVILILFILGMLKYKTNSFLWIVFVGCIGPVLIAIILNSVLYDGWRHFYFIYPLIIIFAVNGVSFLVKKFSFKYVFPIIALGLIPSISFSFKNHPFQQVYFNEIVSKKENNLLERYERDYWGSSFYHGLKELKKYSKKDTIKFTSNIKTAYTNTLMFNQAERPFLKYVSTLDSAEYFISNYKHHPKLYNYKNKLFHISVQNSPIISAWEIK